VEKKEKEYHDPWHGHDFGAPCHAAPPARAPQASPFLRMQCLTCILACNCGSYTPCTVHSCHQRALHRHLLFFACSASPASWPVTVGVIPHTPYTAATCARSTGISFSLHAVPHLHLACNRGSYIPRTVHSCHQRAPHRHFLFFACSASPASWPLQQQRPRAQLPDFGAPVTQHQQHALHRHTMYAVPHLHPGLCSSNGRAAAARLWSACHTAPTAHAPQASRSLCIQCLTCILASAAATAARAAASSRCAALASASKLRACARAWQREGGSQLGGRGDG